MKLRILVVILCGLIISACVGNDLAPQYVVDQHDPILDKSGGVLVIADVCIRRDEIGGSYFTIFESEAAAKTLSKDLNGFLSANNIPVKEIVVPFVCGALHELSNPERNIANRIGGDISSVAQPFGVSDKYKGDQRLLTGLTHFATNAYHKPWVDSLNKKNIGSKTNASKISLPVSKESFETACSIISAKFGTRAILYVGISGVSTSRGLKSATLLANSIVFAATSSTIPLGYDRALLVGMVPFPSIPGSRYLSASIVDLKTGNIKWTNKLQSKGDPVKTAAITDIDSINSLLAGMARGDSKSWTPPGATKP